MGRLVQAMAVVMGITGMVCPLLLLVAIVVSITWRDTIFVIAVPLLAIAPFVLVPFSLTIFDTGRRLRYGGLTYGYCTRCGYDLRASRSAVCPECGTGI